MNDTNNSADSLASAGGVEVEIDRLRDALEHIQKACVLSRTQSRRIRWIETRAHGALIGDDRLHRSIDLPKDGGPDTAEKLRRRMLQDRHTFRVAQGLAAGILSAARSKEREVADGLRAELEAVKRDAKAISRADVSKAARFICDRSAKEMGIDKDDNWKLYGSEYIEDVTDMLKHIGFAIEAAKEG